MNTFAFLAGLAVYAVVATVFGFMALGVGFMEEPWRTIYSHAIVFGPLLPTGFVAGLIARARTSALALAVLLALAAMSIFLLQTAQPVPFFFREETASWATAVQAAYQLALYVALCVVGALAGTAVRLSRRATTSGSAAHAKNGT